jgi:hypothetical protein
MPGSIPAPNSGSFVEKNKKNIGSQMGQTHKKTFKDMPKMKHEVTLDYNNNSLKLHLFTQIVYFVFSLRVCITVNN